MTFSRKSAFRAGDILDRLPRHRLGHESDEVAGMAGLHRDADLAVGLEAADARTVAGARVDHDERPAGRVDLDAARRLDAHQSIIHRSLQVAAVGDQLDLIIENMGYGFGHVLAVLLAALAHDVQEQDTALSAVHEVFKSGCKDTRQRVTWNCRLSHHGFSPLSLPIARCSGAHADF